MNKIKLRTVFLVAVAFLAAAMLHAQSNRQIQTGKIKGKPVTQINGAPTSVPQGAPLIGFRQGYQMVTDVLDGFGGESESDNYRIPVNSGGQPSAIGISESDDYGVEAGYVHAIHFKRGDVNVDELIDLGDLLHLISYLYKGGPACCPKEAGDVNCDGVTDLGDILFVIGYLYKGGPSPSC